MSIVDPSDKLKRAYARLSSLQKNLSSYSSIPETYVAEYHGALEHLEEIGYDIAEFKIPEDLIAPTIASINYRGGGARYTKERYVARALFMTKLDAVLAYFTLDIQAPQRQMGFQGPTKA